MAVAIHAVGLRKRYRLGGRQAYGALRDVLARALAAPRRRFSRARDHGSTDWLWALDEVSFDIEEGETVGLIGRNGSGKSTLLKLLSRITDPTEGYAEIRGRIGSLLEVGTGFHPELTGRENVFVNGAILGMKRQEIARRFDEIVEFADVPRFLDTPVKHYSSGMQMRLAFAVAAHLDPDILLVDEVLAVGDLAFQKKCLGKLDQSSRSGRTVVFVSHQINQLRRLCRRCIWLDRGRVVEIGPTPQVIAHYEHALMSPAPEDGAARNAGARVRSWTLQSIDDNGHVMSTLGPVTVRFVADIFEPIRQGSHGVGLYDADGDLVWGAGIQDLSLDPGRHTFVYRFASLPVRPGSYRWHVSILRDHTPIESAFVPPELLVATPPTGHWRDECAGDLNLDFAVTIEQEDAQFVSAAARHA